MSIEIKVPTVGESISEVTLVKWHKKDGEWANRDEVIAELESEKATFELNAEQAGIIKIIAKEGELIRMRQNRRELLKRSLLLLKQKRNL